MPGDLPSIVTLTLSGAGYFGSSAKPLELCSQRRAQEQSGLSGLAFRIRQAGRKPCSARGELCATTAGGPSSGSPTAPATGLSRPRLAGASRPHARPHVCQAPSTPVVWLGPSPASGDPVSHIGLCLGAPPRSPAPSAPSVLHADGSRLPASRLHLSYSRSWPGGLPEQ